MTDKLLEKEIAFFEKKKSGLLETSRGKFVLIKDEKIIGTFESQKDALNKGFSEFGNQPFLVKKIEDIEEVQNFTSNLIINAPEESSNACNH